MKKNRGTGHLNKNGSEGEPQVRPGIDPERVREVLAKGGKLSWAEFVRCRVRYFADGAVLGSKEWVNATFERNRGRFGPKRKDGARKVRFLSSWALFGLRDLRVEPVTAPRG